MNAASRDTIDQALFGYADGHRQIASSVRLPPKDLYLLSSASDLASGVRLGEQGSYLSGLPLPESRRYALFRTWAAPEMPRPGCVWSHVLLLDPKTSASITALSDVLPLFRRPLDSETSSYGEPLGISISSLVAPVRVDLITEIISGYYIGGRAILSPDSAEPDEIENAILAVWSQQWPRLRSSFSFCTAALNESRRTEQNDYNVQVAPINCSPLVGNEGWVSVAADDAALNKVTPLRRFLWRYGRDIPSSRRQYRMMVDLYLRSDGAEVITANAAFEIFQALPDPADGAVLKRDILGIGPRSPRLVAAVSAIDLLRLLTSAALPEMPTSAQVGNRLEELTSREISNVAGYYVANKGALSPWKDGIYSAFVKLADKSTVLTECPREMIAEILLAREDLVDAETLPLVEDSILPQLIKDNSSTSLARVVMNEMLRRDMGDLKDQIISAQTEFMFQAAIEAYGKNQLHQSWSDRLYLHANIVLAANWLPRVKSTKDFAAALSILRYPRILARDCAEVAHYLSRMTDDAQGSERINMLAALLRAAIDEKSMQSWQMISTVLPELRVVILKGGLSQTAEAMLVNDLPYFYSAGYWDLNKRILLSLSKLNEVAPNIGILQLLNLSPAEIELVLHGEEPPPKNPFLRIWNWNS